VCKRARIEAYRREHPDVVLVHIGNGQVSDLCGAIAADLAFAKDTLASALSARGEAFWPFETLDDVVQALEGLGFGAGSTGLESR
jgi:2-hydroxy-3-keto-5-methylthiopentenyl-1-phosphate phosphatase